MARKNQKRFEIIHHPCAGIDVGSREHWVAVNPDQCENPVRQFTTFTDDLIALADWLQSLSINVVAMEATGVYWIPLFEVLDARGFEVYLVNSRATRQTSGRKSDVLDCQWIWQLMTHVETQIAECDRAIAQALERLPVLEPEPVAPGKPLRSPHRSSDQQQTLHRALNKVMGVDLTAIPTIGVDTALVLASELGPDLSRFPTSGHFCSWLGVAPPTRVSGGKPLSSIERLKRLSKRLPTDDRTRVSSAPAIAPA